MINLTPWNKFVFPFCTIETDFRAKFAHEIIIMQGMEYTGRERERKRYGGRLEHVPQVYWSYIFRMFTLENGPFIFMLSNIKTDAGYPFLLAVMACPSFSRVVSVYEVGGGRGGYEHNKLFIRSFKKGLAFQEDNEFCSVWYVILLLLDRRKSLARERQFIFY